MTGESDQGQSHFRVEGHEAQQGFTEANPEQAEVSQTAESNRIKIDALLTLSEQAHTSNPDSALSRYLSGVPDLYAYNLDLQKKKPPKRRTTPPNRSLAFVHQPVDRKTRQPRRAHRTA